ncbi:MAG: S9 family peptidase [Deltaproteobacteria bacterium]|nr:S9 family peptidase [Deltaproteobacteria bacterium]
MAFATAANAAPPPPAPAAPTVRQQGNLRLDGVPETPPELVVRALQYSNARPLRLVDWLPDGRGLLVATRFGETSQLHHVAAPLGMRAQWTFGQEPVAFAAVRPLTGPLAGPQGDPTAEAAIGIDVGGSEFYQLFHFRRADGKLARITDGKARHESPQWSRDGKHLAFVGTGRNGKDFDLYLWTPGPDLDAPPAPKLAKELVGNWRVTDWSPDGQKVLLLHFLSIEEAEIFECTLQSGDLRPVRADKEGKKAAYGTARYGEAGAIWVTTGVDAEFQRLVRVAADGSAVAVTANIPWKVEEFDVSEDGRKVALHVNEDGWARLYVLDDKLRPVLVPGLPDGVLSGMRWRPDGKALAVSLTGASTPGDVWVVGWESDKKPPTVARWTQTETGGLPPQVFTAPKLVHYPTFDMAGGRRRQIPCFAYKPAGKGPFATVIHIHGGPEGQARPWFDPAVQFWVRELGIAVLVPNVRGSDGYGKSFLELDNGKRRQDSVADIGALIDWVATQPDLDSKRVAAYGGSYGGYMVLASLVQYGDRLKAGIDIVGISNFVTFLENTQAYRRDSRRAEYGDEREPGMREFLHQISPLTHANRIRSRLFVVQGANDPRVPQSEAEQVVRAVRAAGQPVWYMLALDEGHGFAKKSNRDALIAAVAHYWKTHLL